MPDSLLERVDAARGSVPRERFLRELIEAALDDDGYVEPPQKDWRAKAAEVYEGFSAQERPTVTPQPFLQTDLVAGQVSLAPSREERHLHKFVQVPTTEYFVGGVKQAHFECACGASKSDRVRA